MHPKLGWYNITQGLMLLLIHRQSDQLLQRVARASRRHITPSRVLHHELNCLLMSITRGHDRLKLNVRCLQKHSINTRFAKQITTCLHNSYMGDCQKSHLPEHNVGSEYVCGPYLQAMGVEHVQTRTKVEGWWIPWILLCNPANYYGQRIPSAAVHNMIPSPPENNMEVSLPNWHLVGHPLVPLVNK